jgi:hypothetical protein
MQGSSILGKWLGILLCVCSATFATFPSSEAQEIPGPIVEALNLFRPNKVVPGQVGQNPGCVECPGDVSLKFHFELPPTAQQYQTAIDQIERASKILCDATDGNIRIARIEFLLGDEARSDADIWWLQNSPGASYSQGLGTLGRTRSYEPDTPIGRGRGPLRS